MYNQILEYTFKNFLRKQKTVTQLFPKFPERVAAVLKQGGLKLIQTLPNGVWHFKVSSGTQEGVKYDIYLHFKNLEAQLEKWVPVKKLWKKSGTGINIVELAKVIFTDVDLEMDCSCPADLYWGKEYIKTQRGAQYGEPENRRPKIRNPREYGVVCKHAQIVLQSLPFYIITLGNYLKKFYLVKIQKEENKFKQQLDILKKGVAFLSKKQSGE
jgi:hypothetical protein